MIPFVSDTIRCYDKQAPLLMQSRAKAIYNASNVIDSHTRDRLLNTAAQLERGGRLADAAATYEQLLALYPDLADSWFNLGVVRRKLRQYDAALAAYRRALDSGIRQPEEVHVNCGVIYSDHLRQSHAAETELRTALAINATYVPALLNYANLKEDMGKRDEAIELYERILTIDPARLEALARCASASLIRNSDDPMIRRLRTAIDDARTSTFDKASLGFALGKTLDACGVYSDAFNAYVSANQASRESSNQSVNYAQGEQEHLTRLIIEAFPAASVRQKTGAKVRPVFICGMFRSGSTLVEQVLSRHSNVRTGGELDYVPTLVHSMLSPFPQAMKSASKEKLQQLADYYSEALDKLIPGTQHVSDKRPDNFQYIGVIKGLFPDAKIVHTVRHPLDICLSVYFLHLDHRMSYALNLDDIGHYYRQYRRLMEHWKTLYGEDIIDFDYDRFVREPRPAVENLLTSLGLAWEEACLTPQLSSAAVRTASVWQVREPIHARSSGRWRNYARELGPLRKALGELVRD